MCSGLIDNLGVIAGRMACVLTAALLACAFSAHAQVIEEGGFPVKGGDNSGEPFSLTCPSRLVVQAGSSIVLSCSAAAVPEEGIRYEWEPVSVGGLDFLSAPDELSPLFMAPSSGAGEKYAYRLTATAPGVYETADVTVSVEGFSGDSAHDRGEGSAGPGDCSSFAFEGYREGCFSKDEGSQPFGGFSGEEGGTGFPFPGSPGAPEEGLPGLLQAGDPAQQTAPYLDCPPAVFLEELEVGSIECHASDAVGEEFLEYMWEPVGSTTRDYLDNPRLIPEDAPNPSVVAPEAPVYETLEAFHSGETTFRYRYRLTATSRATGLSSSSEVEVFVSSSRPSVYCPEEVEVEEGSSIVLECVGVDPLSRRLDYDEASSPVEWSWTGLWGTSTAPLLSTEVAAPVFEAPPGSAGRQYHYIASMASSASGAPLIARRRVTVTVTGEGEGEQDAAEIATDDSSPPRNRFLLGFDVTCSGGYYHAVYAATDNFTLDCSASGGPDGVEPTYVWTGSEVAVALLSDPNIRNPVFMVPDEDEVGEAREEYEYTLTASIPDTSLNASLQVEVNVIPPDVVFIVCPGGHIVDEGAVDFTMGCRRIPGGPDTTPVYSWTGSDEAIALLSKTDIVNPTFHVPGDITGHKLYVYLLTMKIPNGNGDSGLLFVIVLDTDPPVVACTPPYPVYEGTGTLVLDCEASYEPDGATYSWTGTDIDNRLTGDTKGPAPTFDVPDNVDSNTDYEYTVTLSADGIDDVTADVTVTVLNKKPLDVSCAPVSPVYEGSADFALDCSASGAPAGSTYGYAWTARGSTTDTALLISGTDGPTPTFAVPDALDATTTYEYLLTVSAENAESSSAAVTVTVLNRGALSAVCVDPPSVYEGSPDVTLDCSASGAPAYDYAWTARGATPNTDLLIAGTDGPTPTFAVPDALDATTTYEYRLTVSADNAESASEEVAVTVLNQGALRVVCTDPPSVYEGSADFALDCSASGAPAGSTYDYAWTARGATPNTDLLIAGTDSPTPTFAVPDALDATTTYEYLLTVSAENAESGTANVTVTVLNRGALAVVCTDPPSVYEGSADFALDCSASGAPAGSEYDYVWTARGSTADTDLLIAGTDGPTPTFAVPDEVNETTTYEYLLTVSAENAKDASAEITVTVLNRGSLAVACADPGSVYEGSADVRFDCSASGAPAGSSYAYAWTARGSTGNTSLLTGTETLTPTFSVPDDIPGRSMDTYKEIYEYRLTVSVEGIDDVTADVAVVVLEKPDIRCIRYLTPVSVDFAVSEGFRDITIGACPDGWQGAPGNVYVYVWTTRGDTPDTSLLSAANIPRPLFLTPDLGDLSEDTVYKYKFTVSADNADPAIIDVNVYVSDKIDRIAVACADPGSVYEGSEDIALDCSASGAPSGSSYTYTWTAWGATPDTALLSAVGIASPIFYVPDEVDGTTTYKYRLTVSAGNAESGMAAVTVTVLDRGALAVVCTDPPSVYEGSEDITFDCTASGAPDSDSQYTYVWTARGETADTALLIAGTDGPTPTFEVPDEVDETTTYEYLLTVSAENAESGTAEVTVTVLNRGALSVTCEGPDSVYEGSEDITFDCTASGAPAGSTYDYAWTARGSTSDTALLIAGTDGPTPTFEVPDEVDETTTYEYLLTVSAENAESGTAEVTVTVLNRGALSVTCEGPDSVYEGSEDITFDCTASGAPAGSTYDYAWTARGSTSDTALLIAGTDGPTPTFEVPDEVDETTTYEYLLTVSAENAESGTAEVTVTVLNRGVLAVACTNPDSVYEGSEDFALDCSASGAPAGSAYDYVWTARGDTQDTSLLSAVGIASPVFLVPDEVAATTTYEYLLTVSAANAEDATAEVAVTVLDRAVSPPSDPVSPPLASSSAREPSTPSALGVTVSTSSLRFGVQSADTEVSLDPLTDQISTYISGPYHAGRMALSPGGGEEALEDAEDMALSIELASPVVLRRKGGVEDASIVLSPNWSRSESCEQLSSQAIGGLYTEVTLSEGDCRLLYFGGELDLTDVPSGHYAGSMDVILRSVEREETYSMDVDVTVIPVQRVITIGSGGVRFSTLRKLSASLTEEQNLSIYPTIAFLTEKKPNGVFELSNPSLVPLEVSVSARFGYTEVTADGREVVVEDASGSRLGDLSSVVDIYPGILVLQPGEKKIVRYGVKEGALASMAEKGYAAFFDVVSSPRQYVRTDRMPEEVTGDRTARVTMRVPGVYVPDEGASQLRATLLSISYVGSLSATFLLETQDRPFVGEVLAYDGEGRELGRRETLVYTRSRVRIPLDRIPEGGAVFLRFAPRGSDRVPLPVSVEWDAPRRDIGGMGDKDRTTNPETLAGKP